MYASYKFKENNIFDYSIFLLNIKSLFNTGNLIIYATDEDFYFQS
jgi:hypothetical protein